jgi:hypothetical protein
MLIGLFAGLVIGLLLAHFLLSNYTEEVKASAEIDKTKMYAINSPGEILKVVVSDLRDIEKYFGGKKLAQDAAVLRAEAMRLQKILAKDSMADIKEDLRKFLKIYVFFIDQCNQEVIKEIERRKKNKKEGNPQGVTTASCLFLFQKPAN